MKHNFMRKLAFVVLAFTFGSVAAFAADFNGRWTASVQGQGQGRRGSQAQNITFDFHVDGSALTGKVITQRGETEISNGTVDGDNISFDQMVHFNGNEVTMHYSGTADGDVIHFSRQVSGGPSMNLDARRVSDSSAPGAQPQ